MYDSALGCLTLDTLCIDFGFSGLVSKRCRTSSLKGIVLSNFLASAVEQAD